jgi:hypothetical protein
MLNTVIVYKSTLSIIICSENKQTSKWCATELFLERHFEKRKKQWPAFSDHLQNPIPLRLET